jgi:hypothetical protein
MDFLWSVAVGEGDEEKKSPSYASGLPLSDADFCPRHPLQ